MIFNREKLIAVAVFLAFPILALAQPTNFADLVDNFILPILRLFVSLIIGISTLYFLWNGVKLILNADNAQVRAESRQGMIGSVVVIFIMVSFWAIIAIFQNTFGV